MNIRMIRTTGMNIRMIRIMREKLLRMRRIPTSRERPASRISLWKMRTSLIWSILVRRISLIQKKT